MSILDEIFFHKRDEVEKKRQEIPLEVVKRQAMSSAPSLDFTAAFRHAENGKVLPALIAEVKHRSPSRGILAPDFDPINLARTYAQNGASAISVLTDERYFGGQLSYLRKISEIGLGIPLLRKDFIFDPYQVFEARAAGADAILLIAAALDSEQMQSLHRLALELGMTPLIEVHNPVELQLALNCEPRLIGINNRNLHDFSVSLDTTLQLLPSIPQEVTVVSESGIRSQLDLKRLAAAGVDAVLIGEALVTSPDVAFAVREFCGGELTV